MRAGRKEEEEGKEKEEGKEGGKVGGVVFTPSYGPSSPVVALTLAYCGEEHW